MFRKISLALSILTDSAKRTYIDTRLEADRKKRERYAEMNKKQKEMVDVSIYLLTLSKVCLARGRSWRQALHAREEEARLAKIQLQKRKREETEEESIKEAGRRMLEEAQKRAAAAAAAASSAQSHQASASGRTNGSHAQHNHVKGSHANGSASKMPNITPADLSLILTIPSVASTSNLEQRIISIYGPLAHFILKPPAEPKDLGKKKGKAWKAIVEFEKGNWGGCWACWKDHQKDSPAALGGIAPGLGDGVRARWVGGEEPAWVAWASQGGMGSTAPRPSSNGSGSTAREGATRRTTGPDIPFSATALPDPFANLGANAAPVAAPSFGSAPDFGSTTMADLLASHASSKAEKEDQKRKAEEFESMTLFQMRQRERERLAAQIRAEEGDEWGVGGV
jgi:DnaJ family protein C protein 17